MVATSLKKSLHVAPTSPIVSPRHGGVAQLGERLTGSQEVRGSIPLVSTIVNARPSGNRRPFFISIHHAAQSTALIIARARKMLRKLLLAFVLCLLANCCSKTKMPRHFGHIASGYIQTPLIHLRQCEYSCKTTPPSSAAYSLRVAQHSLYGAP